MPHLFKKTFLYASVCHTTLYRACYTEKKFCIISKKYTIRPVKICPYIRTFLVLFLLFPIAFLTGPNPANICRSHMSMGCLLKLNNSHASLSNQLCSFVASQTFSCLLESHWHPLSLLLKPVLKIETLTKWKTSIYSYI